MPYLPAQPRRRPTPGMIEARHQAMRRQVAAIADIEAAARYTRLAERFPYMQDQYLQDAEASRASAQRNRRSMMA